MKTFTITALTALVASPALAHAGAHLNPHGIELAVAGLAAASVAVYAVVRRR